MLSLPSYFGLSASFKHTLHHINRVKLFLENSDMARLHDVLRIWGAANLQNITTLVLRRSQIKFFGMSLVTIKTETMQ